MLGVSFYVCNDTLNSVFPPILFQKRVPVELSKWVCALFLLCFGPRSCLRCGIIWSNNSLNILIRLRVCLRVYMGAKQWLSVASGPAGVRPYLGTVSTVLAHCPASSCLSWHPIGPHHKRKLGYQLRLALWWLLAEGNSVAEGMLFCVLFHPASQFAYWAS